MNKKLFSLLLAIALLFSSAVPFGVFAEGTEELPAPETEVITVVEEPAAEAPVVEEPAAEEPVVEEPAVEELAVEEPVVEEPAVEEPAVEEPAVEEPAVEEPVVEEPAAESVVEEPAEKTEGYILLPDGTEIFSDWDTKELFATVNGDSLVFGRVVSELSNGKKLYRVTFDTENTKDTDNCLGGYVKLQGDFWKDAELTAGRLVNDIRIPVISVTLAAVEEPVVEEPVVEEPVVEEPAVEEPVVEEPAVEEPVVEEPVVEEPVVEEPVVEEPVVEEPVDEEPVVEEPVVEEPVVEEPVDEEPVVEEPVVEEPVVEEPVVEEPVVEEPAEEEIVAEEPAEEEIVVEEPAEEEIVVEEPAAEEPVVEEPAAEEPVVEEPVAEEPVVEEPVAEEPAAEKPAEEESEIVADPETDILTQEELEAYFGAAEVFASANATEVIQNQDVKFTVTLKNIRGSVTYQWQKSPNNGKTWSNTVLYGNQTKELSFKANQTRANYIYRCEVKDTYGGTYYTNGVLVRFVTELTSPNSLIATASVNYSIVSIGSDVKMKVSVKNATGAVSYQWEKSPNNGKTWSNTVLYGNQTKELSFKATETRLNYIYRCAVTDSTGTYYSNSLKVNPTAEPEAFDDVTVTVAIKGGKIYYNDGEEVAFVATVQGSTGNLTYQWEKSNDGGATWSNTTLYGNKTKELSFKATDSRLRSIYRCTVTDNNGMHFSDSVKAMLRIVTVAAEKDIVAEGAQVKLTATVSKTGDMTYQWQRTKDGGENWLNITSLSGYNTTTLTFKATADRCQYTYRCVVTIVENGESVQYQSEGVQVVIGEEPAETSVINDVTYELVEGAWTVKSYSGSAASLTIEEEIDGKKVTRIGASAFEGNTNLVSIDLPDTIEVIERCAFKNCTNLANMY